MAQSFGLGAFLSIASLLAKSFGFVFIDDSNVIPIHGKFVGENTMNKNYTTTKTNSDRVQCQQQIPPKKVLDLILAVYLTQ